MPPHPQPHRASPILPESLEATAAGGRAVVPAGRRALQDPGRPGPPWAADTQAAPGNHAAHAPAARQGHAPPGGPSAQAVGGHGTQLPEGSRTAYATHVATEANPDYRQYMEDSAVVVDPFALGDRDGERWGFYAVYDGHGGRQAVDYCEAKLHEVVLDELRAARPRHGPISDEAIAEALARSFQRVDDQLRLVGAWRCGCTATVVLLNRSRNGPRIHVANVGDSRCVTVSSQGCERLSRDHRPTDQAEVKRIEADGGFVSRGRVAGVLGVSRALGDHSIKSSGVSWRPHVVSRDAPHDAAVIIASDGLWDTVEDGDARLLVERRIRERAPDRAAKSLVEEAIRRGSMDNITCLVTYVGNPAKM